MSSPILPPLLLQNSSVAYIWGPHSLLSHPLHTHSHKAPVTIPPKVPVGVTVDLFKTNKLIVIILMHRFYFKFTKMKSLKIMWRLKIGNLDLKIEVYGHQYFAGEELADS